MKTCMDDDTISVKIPAPKRQTKHTNDQFKEKLCEIPPTNPIPYPDPIKTFVPPRKTVLGYDIGQHEMELKRAVQYGVVQFRMRKTKATYDLPPPGYEFPEDRLDVKKLPYGAGNPPCWKFQHEIWWEKVQRKQEMYKKRFRALQIENRKYDRMHKPPKNEFGH